MSKKPSAPRRDPATPRYEYIRAWGALMGSFAYYVEEEQQRAASDQAPPDAISHTYTLPDGRGCSSFDQGAQRTWRTVRDLTDPGIRHRFQNACLLCRIDPPDWEAIDRDRQRQS